MKEEADLKSDDLWGRTLTYLLFEVRAQERFVTVGYKEPGRLLTLRF